MLKKLVSFLDFQIQLLNRLIFIIKSCLYNYSSNGLNKCVNDFKKYIFLLDEANKISFLNKRQNVWIIYDNSVSPPTYGNINYMLFIARYLEAKGHSIRFSIISVENKISNRNSWNILFKQNKHNWYMQEQLYFSRELLNTKKSFAEIKKWNEIKEEIEISKDFILFKKSISKRKPIYIHGLNMLNIFLSSESEKIKNKTFVGEKYIRKKISKFSNKFPKNYISVGVRLNPFWGNDREGNSRNSREDEILKVLNCLYKNFPNFKIIIISDVNGCEYIKKIESLKKFKNLSFSKDFSSNYIEDFCILSGSQFHIHVRQTGICVAAIASQIPYYLIGQLNNEIMASIKKLTSWSSSNQIYFDGHKLEENPNWEKDINKIASEILKKEKF